MGCWSIAGLLPALNLPVPIYTPGCLNGYRGRRDGLVVSALDSGAIALGSSPGRGHCVLFLVKTLYSHGASLPCTNCLRYMNIPNIPLYMYTRYDSMIINKKIIMRNCSKHCLRVLNARLCRAVYRIKRLNENTKATTNYVTADLNKLLPSQQ